MQTARAYVEALRDYWATRSEVDQLLAGRVASRPTRMGPEPPATESAGGEH